MTKITIKNKDGKIIKTLDSTINKTILSQLREQGLEVNSACHTGMCGACMFKIEDGKENVVKNLKGEPAFMLGEEEVMTCIAGIKEGNSQVVLKEIY